MRRIAGQAFQLWMMRPFAGQRPAPKKRIMSAEITVTLPDETYRQAEHLATITGRAVADVLAEAEQFPAKP